MADPNVKLALRVHDECNGELSLPDQSFSNLVLSEVARLVVVGVAPPPKIFDDQPASQNKHADSESVTPFR